MLLYNSQDSGNCYNVRLLLTQLGHEYARHEVDVIDRSGRPELLGRLNPALRIPTLILDNGRPLAESNAILWYFGDGTQYAPEPGFELEPYPAIRAWLERVAAQPGYYRDLKPGATGSAGRLGMF